MPRKKGTPTELTTIPLGDPNATDLLEDLMESYAASVPEILQFVLTAVKHHPPLFKSKMAG